MSDSQKIGTGTCPVCASGKAQFTFTKKQLACVTCNACNFQGFARSERSDELLRAKIKAAPVQPDTAPGATVPAKPAPTNRTRESLMSW